jgi:type VI secretion system secreted protein VgrG
MASINKYKFSILNGSGYRIAVSNFNAEEKISAPYTITLKLVSEDQIKLDDVIKSEALLTIAGKDVDRYFHGHICNFAMTGRIDRFYTYNATVVPYAWFMDLNKNYRIFQNMTVVNIAKKLLDENRIASDEYEFKLKNDYQKRRYCTQYGESDLRFIRRILEEEGIFFFFEHTEDSHTIIFSDTEEIYDPIDGESEIEFNNDSNMVAEKETLRDFTCDRAICPGKITHTNYNFKRPSLDMKLNEEGETHTEHELYEYPGAYGLPPQGSPKVRNHLEQAKSLELTIQGSGNCSRFLPGFTFSVSDHPFNELNGEYCLASVNHHGSQSGVYGEHGGIGGDYTYANSFVAIPSKTVYRTGQAIEKPYVKGLQSAVVTGPPGEEIHTDEYGRIKVQFHWDRKGKKDEKSSCWLRTSQPWSGNGWGMVSLPRVGDEVLVDFINGDPDWPIMVGNVNNAESPALYSLPAKKTQSGIKTRSYPKGGPDNFNELRFEDKKGAEEVYLQGEKDWNILIKNDKGQNVGHDETLTVQNNRTKTVGVDQTVTVGSNHTETIGANKFETVVINKAETIGAAKELTIGGLYQTTVVGAMNESVGLAKAEEVGLEKAVVVGADMTERIVKNREINVGNHFEINAGDSFTIVCGKSFIRMDKEGNVTINGAKFDFEASGHVQITGKDIDLN